MKSVEIILLFVFILKISIAKELQGTAIRATCGPRKVEQCSFIDRFYSFKSNIWVKTFGYVNGPPFNSWWSSKNVFVNQKSRTLGIEVSKRFDPESGLVFASGELKSKGRFGHGCYEARMAPIAQPG